VIPSWSELVSIAADTRPLPAKVRRFVGWIGQDTVEAVNSDGTVALESIPLPAAVVRPYEPVAGDIVEVLRGRSFAIVLRKVEE
jgi:hypothetical protein